MISRYIANNTLLSSRIDTERDLTRRITSIVNRPSLDLYCTSWRFGPSRDKCWTRRAAMTRSKSLSIYQVCMRKGVSQVCLLYGGELFWPSSKLGGGKCLLWGNSWRAAPGVQGQGQNPPRHSVRTGCLMSSDPFNGLGHLIPGDPQILSLSGRDIIQRCHALSGRQFLPMNREEGSEDMPQCLGYLFFLWTWELGFRRDSLASIRLVSLVCFPIKK